MATKITKSTGITKGSGTKFVLPNKKVTLKPIVRNTMFMGIENHDGAFMFTGSFQVWTIFRDQYGKYKDPLTEIERKHIESIIDEDLNINHKDNYWHKFEVKIKKDTYNIDHLKRVFDLKNPLDYMAYKLLLTAPDVANSWDSRNDTPEYRWALIDKDEPIQSKLTMGKMKASTYSWLDENKNKPTVLRDMLHVMNIGVDRDTPRDELESALIELIEDKRKLELLYDNVNDEGLHLKVFFVKALKARELTHRKGKYYDKDGELIGVTKNAVIEWLGNPENSTRYEMMSENIKKLNI